MGEEFVCPNCGNHNSRYIGHKDNKPYCRLCVSMRPKEKITANISGKATLHLNYPLTDKQFEVSEQVLKNFKEKLNTLIYAVTGAGKTELVYKTMLYALTNKLSVGFAVPRKQVVIELAERIKKAFIDNKVISVYGGHTDDLTGEIIVLTTHQLYRYQNYFDLLILDEIDAFPFKDNELLNNMFHKAVKGNYILMSATPNDETINYFKKEGRRIVFLNERHHKKSIPVPKIIIASGYTKHIRLIRELKRFILKNKKVFIFCPTIERATSIYFILSRYIKAGELIHSKIKNQAEIISDFKLGKYDYLVTTAVLERGVTVKGLQVIVMDADHSIYDRYSLEQISGRVGRDHNEPEGEVIYIANSESIEMEESIKKIISYNEHL